MMLKGMQQKLLVEKEVSKELNVTILFDGST